MSLAQAGYDSGLLMGNFEWMAGFTLVLLALFFVPFYIRSKVATLPDFLESTTVASAATGSPWSRWWRPSCSTLPFRFSTGWIVLHGVFGMKSGRPFL